MSFPASSPRSGKSGAELAHMFQGTGADKDLLSNPGLVRPRRVAPIDPAGRLLLQPAEALRADHGGHGMVTVRLRVVQEELQVRMLRHRPLLQHLPGRKAP